MEKIRKIIIIVILIIIILIGNSYAASVNQMNSASLNQANFKVVFSGEPKVSDKDKVKAAVTDDLSATINVTGLTMRENTETITYIVQNTSTDLSADLSVKITNSNTEYFSIETNIEKTTLIKGEATKVTIKIELIKEPIRETEKSIIGIQLKAVPVQPIEDEDNYDDNEKDDTPKTGNFKFIDIFWR